MNVPGKLASMRIELKWKLIIFICKRRNHPYPRYKRLDTTEGTWQGPVWVTACTHCGEKVL